MQNSAYLRNQRPSSVQRRTRKKRSSLAPTPHERPESPQYENLISYQSSKSLITVSKQEVEIERLKTTVDALNNRCFLVD